MERQSKIKLIKFSIIIGVSLGVYIVLKYMLPIVAPFVIAYALYRLLYPLILKIRRKIKIPMGILASIFIFILAAICFLLCALIFSYIFNQLAKLIQNSEEIMAKGMGLIDQLCYFVKDFLGCEYQVAHQYVMGGLNKVMDGLEVRIFSFIAENSIPFLKQVATIVVVLVIAMVAAILLIKNKKKIAKGLYRSIFAKEVSHIIWKACLVIGCFCKAQIIIMSIIGVVCGITLYLLGNPYAILIGVVIAILDALPVIGSGTVLIPWAIIRFISADYRRGIILLVAYGICTFTREFLEAKLMGEKLGINEFYMLMSTFIGLNLFGIWGIILGPLGLMMILEVVKQAETLVLGKNKP